MTVPNVTFSHYDTADYLQTEEDIAAYLDAVMEENDPALLAAALGDIARARNMSQLAKDVGMSREGSIKLFRGKAILHFRPSARSLIPWECAYLLNRYRGQKRAARTA